jgi:DNA-binding CsgD family transcriptional regulator
MYATRDVNDDLKKQEKLPPNTIGEFTIDKHRYLILLLSEPPDETTFTRESDQEVLPEISHFEIHGQHCVIIEAEPPSTNNQPSLVDLLTEREVQIATLVSLGRVNKQIARQLHISPWTVATHLRRIFYKLGVDSRAAMVYRCASLIKQVQTENGLGAALFK